VSLAVVRSKAALACSVLLIGGGCDGDGVSAAPSASDGASHTGFTCAFLLMLRICMHAV